MAILPSDDLTRVRQELSSGPAVISYLKPQINAALQAIEETMTTRLIVAGDLGSTMPQILSAAINVATVPFVFTVVQKKVLFAWWAELKFRRDK